MGGIVVMGRRTYDRRSEPLVGRINVVVTHRPQRTICDIPTHTMVKYVAGDEILRWDNLSRKVWLAGGESIYRQYLPACSELYLSVVNQNPIGDVHFPAHERLFDLVNTVLEEKDFKVLHYKRVKGQT
jgi:dihydrofolate reductase